MYIRGTLGSVLSGLFLTLISQPGSCVTTIGVGASVGGSVAGAGSGIGQPASEAPPRPPLGARAKLTKLQETVIKRKQTPHCERMNRLVGGRGRRRREGTDPTIH